MTAHLAAKLRKLQVPGRDRLAPPRPTRLGSGRSGITPGMLPGKSGQPAGDGRRIASGSVIGRYGGRGSMPPAEGRPGAGHVNRRFTSTEVVYGVTGTGVTELPEYGMSL